MTAPKRVLVISAHPDDEALGCGGTMLKHVAAGGHLAWMIATRAHEPRWTASVITAKAREVDAAAAAYGAADVTRCDLPTTTLDDLPLSTIIDAFEPAFARTRPEIVYLVHPGDVHTDHHAVFRAAWTLMKGFKTASQGPARVLLFETLSSTDAAPPLAGRQFVPNAYSDITPFIEQKLAIAALYESEMQADPLPRTPSAIRALARVRGAAVGVAYAEAFQILRDAF